MRLVARVDASTTIRLAATERLHDALVLPCRGDGWRAVGSRGMTATAGVVLRFRHRLALAGAAVLLVGVVLHSAHVDVGIGAGPELGDQAAGAVLEPSRAATVPVVGRARTWAEAELTSLDPLARTSLVVFLAGWGLLPLSAASWWLSRPAPGVTAPQRLCVDGVTRASSARAGFLTASHLRS